MKSINIPVIKSHRPINIPKYTGFAMKTLTIRYIIPTIIATTPFHLLPPDFDTTPMGNNS